MRFVYGLFLTLLTGSVVFATSGLKSHMANKAGEGLYGIQINALDGTSFDMAALKGKVVLFVNVASRCGFTGQYEGLQTLYETYKDDGLIIIGSPSNDFYQESGDAQEIASFCSLTYGVTFPLTEKISVKRTAHPLYKYLTQSNPELQRKVSWNFNKFLVDRTGKVIAHYGSRVEPNAPEIEKDIKTALAL
ncbi:MAG: glutathione peroxidase [bacterium]|nr:glutathione peroxidase [bacterium]